MDKTDAALVSSFTQNTAAHIHNPDKRGQDKITDANNCVVNNLSFTWLGYDIVIGIC